MGYCFLNILISKYVDINLSIMSLIIELYLGAKTSEDIALLKTAKHFKKRPYFKIGLPIKSVVFKPGTKVGMYSKLKQS